MCLNVHACMRTYVSSFCVSACVCVQLCACESVCLYVIMHWVWIKLWVCACVRGGGDVCVMCVSVVCVCVLCVWCVCAACVSVGVV